MQEQIMESEKGSAYLGNNANQRPKLFRILPFDLAVFQPTFIDLLVDPQFDA
ncbi:hypothetical protein [Shewanella algae]|uniref:hypothetical protein n=1 Tax=Shewanella algae TaxID=38313 RepID=UPI0031F52783